MKTFSCGDVVPGCDAVFTAPDEAGILAQVTEHARECPDITHVSVDIATAVREHIRAA